VSELEKSWLGKEAATEYAKTKAAASGNQKAQTLKSGPTDLDALETMITTTCERLEAKGQSRDEKSTRGKIAKRLRQAFGAVGPKLKDIKSFMAILPEGSEYCSIICGTLSIMLTAADKAASWDGDMIHALGKIHSVLVGKVFELSKELYRGDAELHSLTSSLLGSIFNLLAFLAKESSRKTIGKQVPSSTRRPRCLSGALS
jgi:hypothetical protein